MPGKDIEAKDGTPALKSPWFHILLAWADRAQHGYAIRKSCTNTHARIQHGEAMPGVRERE